MFKTAEMYSFSNKFDTCYCLHEFYVSQLPTACNFKNTHTYTGMLRGDLHREVEPQIHSIQFSMYTISVYFKGHQQLVVEYKCTHTVHRELEPQLHSIQFSLTLHVKLCYVSFHGLPTTCSDFSGVKVMSVRGQTQRWSSYQ